MALNSYMKEATFLGRSNMVYILVAAAIFAADFFIKKYIDKKRKLGEQSTILGERIIVRKYYNKGAIFDSLEKRPALVRILCGSVLVLVCGAFFLLLREKGKHGLKLGLAMIIGGGASNFYDRIAKGHVVDYFSVKSRFPKLQKIIFNISDWFIFLGTVLMLLFHKE